MLPTPSTSHVPYARVYEPAEDSFLLLDTLSSPSETAFLARHFPLSPPTPSPLVLEVGPGSGVVLAFLTAHAHALFSRRDILTLGIDVNRFACQATGETVRKAMAEDAAVTAAAADGAGPGGEGYGYYLAAAQGDLTSPVRPGTVDVLVFNPPYVPTPEVPSVPIGGMKAAAKTTTYEEDSALLALSYAGGKDGMEITERLIEELPVVLSDRGVAYLLLCAQNKPQEVKQRVRQVMESRGGAGSWRVETVGTSGKQAGWEKLQIVRIWQEENV
ncbi:methyltransferase domain-containing protein [Chaetomium strumarium]|uniref:Methyltransferase domain-containing protein n=1 Tax=Chaetomium strumarium TaxID=1170767 RepID=A0AAJ0H3I0_9PEZI|nr:methyltransferase domain-containing protein [Chaetomium strumarium]